MKVTLKLIGGFVHTVGFSQKELDVEPGTTVARHPGRDRDRPRPADDHRPERAGRCEPDEELRAGRPDPRLADLLGRLSARAVPPAQRARRPTAAGPDPARAGTLRVARPRRVPRQRIPMTTTPRLKITYATLRADNEELHALYEAGLEKARARLGALPPQLSSTASSATATGTFEVRSPIDTRHPRRAPSPGARARTSRTRSRRPAARSRPGSASAGSERLEILRRPRS